MTEQAETLSNLMREERRFEPPADLAANANVKADAYAEASGRSLADLGYWHAFGLWKLAVIAEGVLRRAQDDPRNAPDGGPAPREAVDVAIDRAWDIAAAAGLDR